MKKAEIIIMGGGLAGLSAGFTLVRAKKKVLVLEAESQVGGLSKTIVSNGFRFDLGGHRFLSEDKELDTYVKKILHNDYEIVARKSKLLLKNKLFDYPLKPANALFSFGPVNSTKAMIDFILEQCKGNANVNNVISLEDWLVKRFGRKLFDLFFKEYSEKVWGIDCNSISQEWVAQRIKGLSLGIALKNAFYKGLGRKIPTLSDQFLYPRNGIGHISDNLTKKIEEKNQVLSGTRVTEIIHDGSSIKAVRVNNGKDTDLIEGTRFISSIPLTELIQILRPKVPEVIAKAANNLRFRDLVIVTLMLDLNQVTNLSWMYIPEKTIPFGRIHEPKNWSRQMAPDDKTHLVTEYFCFEGDSIWSSEDKNLAAITVDQLAKIGLIQRKHVIGSHVIRVPKAYPILSVGYKKYYLKILEFLKNFNNLQIVGRGGSFRYYNIDHTMRSGILAAENILERSAIQNWIDPYQKERLIS